MNAVQVPENWPIPERELKRRAPSQKRSEQTCAAILDATDAILAEPGSQSLTTNHIAQRAGVNIATLYRYFASVDDIVATLYERQAERRRAALIQTIQQTADRPWQERTCNVVEAIVEERRQKKSCSNLRRKMHSSPQLKELERGASSAYGALISKAMQNYRDIPVAQAQLVANVATDMLNASLDTWEQDASDLPEARVEELKKALIAYLALYLD